MEWVETTGRTIEEAKDAALDQLGVDETDAEFVIVSEPKAGLFGRMRGEARVRARVRPTSPRPKRGRARRSGEQREPRREGGARSGRSRSTTIGGNGSGGGRGRSSGGIAVADRGDEAGDDGATGGGTAGNGTQPGTSSRRRRSRSR
ncbi:MAG TPA: Jag N-terminal domain-containing protein, partial [Acidimicrobiales bacterium]|nr:Jag N-terminal domain-containing protein [Acidimicrobiales bacterium]